MPILSIFVVLFYLPNLFALDPYTHFTSLDLPPKCIGPESIALDRFNQGPYVGISDGRILKYNGPNVGFVLFAYTSPNRTNELCDGVTDPNLGPTCGRPFGFSFNNFNGVLYIVDAFLGLFKVGPEGGLATLIAKSAGGVPFKFLNGIDVDQLTGDVYLTDASQTFDLRNVIQGNYVPDSTGRLIKYNSITKELKVLLDGLSIPAGPVVSTDRTFVLFSEFSTKTVKKYCLTGLKANTTEALFKLPGNPVKIKRAPEPGKFWVTVNEIDQQQPRNATPFGYTFDSFGEILLIKNLEDRYSNIIVNLVQEYNGGRVYVGSREVKFVGMYGK